MPAHPIANSVGSEIRAEMGRQRMSMVKLSKITGVPRGTLFGQINGGTVTVDNLVLIAQALAVEPSDLLPEQSEQAS
jgi:transcriptional regulator with XRE-family HTH domain